MARANRHYLPGYVWHITHRCHKREFLLNFSKDKQRWLHWLFEARRRFNLQILNYVVTSNHIHLLVFDKEGGAVLPRSIQLVAWSDPPSPSLVRPPLELELAQEPDWAVSSINLDLGELLARTKCLQ